MKYFFYGTLRDPLVLRLVLGRRLRPASLQPARLREHACVFRRGATYPVLVVAPGESTEGTLVNGLTGEDARRLAAYEGPEYVLATHTVITPPRRQEQVFVFLPSAPETATRRRWTLETWRARHRAAFVARLRRRRPVAAEAARPGATPAG